MLKGAVIAIIGGGAAGLMAAATILESDFDGQIFLFDKNNQLGAKVIISGGGRCNVTTGVRDQHALLKNYTRGSVFLKAALSKFTPKMVYEWFEDHGVPLKMEPDLRAFPLSNDGHDIVRVFENMFTAKGLRLKMEEPVVNLHSKEGKFILDSSKGMYVCDKVIITTGGNAYRQTGSTGDGYAFAQALGHTITQLGPSLNSFVTKEKWVADLSGITFERAELKYKDIKVAGPFLFTHFGISGPVTFSLSSHLTYKQMTSDNPCKIFIKPYASKNFSDWDEDIKKLILEKKGQHIKNALQAFFPERFVSLVLSLSSIDKNKKCAEIKRNERHVLSRLLSGEMVLHLVKRRPGDEFVTAGGILTEEINPQTMESYICPGLYFGGEVMDIDGVTGGFNLQSSWATGRLAGYNAIKLKK